MNTFYKITCIILAVAVIGLGAGWYLEYSHAQTQLTASKMLYAKPFPSVEALQSWTISNLELIKTAQQSWSNAVALQNKALSEGWEVFACMFLQFNYSSTPQSSYSYYALSAFVGTDEYSIETDGSVSKIPWTSSSYAVAIPLGN